MFLKDLNASSSQNKRSRYYLITCLSLESSLEFLIDVVHPVNIYLLKVNIETLEKCVKYV